MIKKRYKKQKQIERGEWNEKITVLEYSPMMI